MLTQVAKEHRAIIPYLEFQHGPSKLLSDLWKQDFSWDVFLGMRSYCQLRIGLLVLSNRGRCRFCSAGVRNSTVHVLGCCKFWSPQRNVFLQACQVEGISPDAVTQLILRVQTHDPAFALAVLWVDEISRKCNLENKKHLTSWRSPFSREGASLLTRVWNVIDLEL